MDFFPPFRNKEEIRNYMVFILISIVLFFLFDYCYEYNILYLNGIEYYKDHTIPAYLYSISNIPFIIAVMTTLAKFTRGIIEWFRYVSAFAIDICIVYMCFAFRDPSQENTNLNILILVSIGIFLTKIVLCKRLKSISIS